MKTTGDSETTAPCTNLACSVLKLYQNKSTKKKKQNPKPLILALTFDNKQLLLTVTSPSDVLFLSLSLHLDSGFPLLLPATRFLH